MEHARTSSSSRRKPCNITVDEQILADAKKLKLNISQLAEQAMAEAIRKQREAEWLEENRDAIAAHNERIEKYGTLLKPIWQEAERDSDY